MSRYYKKNIYNCNMENVVNDNDDIIENANIIENNKSKTVEIDLNLLQDLRNVIEVANERIHWKTNELLPVGVLIKRLDELLSKNS
jgi:hypothetical protein